MPPDLCDQILQLFTKKISVMNYLFFILSLFLNTYTTNNLNNNIDGDGSTTVTNPEPGGGKKGKSGDGDFIIATDINP